VPSAPAPKAAEYASNVHMEILPVAAPQDELVPTVVPESATTPAGDDASQSSTHTHILLPPPGKLDSASADALPEATPPVAAPPVMAAVPVSADSETPKEVVEAAPVVAVETAAAPTSAVEAKPDEAAVVEEQTAAPDVLAAPPAETTPAEVIPVTVKPEEVAEDKPAEVEQVGEGESASEATPETAAPAEASPATATETPAPAAEGPKEANVIPTTPKKAAASAPSTPPSNGHSRFGTLRSGSIRKLTFPGQHRRASSQANLESESVDKSPGSSVNDSARKKRMSFFGKIKEVLHKDHKTANGAAEKSN
jgi:hypothetical protein